MPAVEVSKRRRQAAVGVAVACLLALPFAYSAVIVPLSPWEQAEVSLLMIGLAVPASLSRPLRPLIVFLSGFASLRYFYWRVTSTLNLDGPLDATFSLLLLAAEVYGVLVLFLGYFQTIEMERRTPPPLTSLPSVDVFIPTYNESIEIVRRTLIGALAIEYPRKQVFLLDDGRRESFEAMARELGAFYLTRPDNAHAKAGNLNRALRRTHGELIAIFDADHVPVRGFLRKTVGFFEDEKVALVQTAQHFFNPDPYERNLNLQGRIAPEQTFFYHVIQPGNDFWNSAFFCGSCAVLRRSAIESIGGFKVKTVTEDAHTALELHARGWRSVYLGLPLAAGLATESFAAHVVQRMRWARGMAQILRLDCPLLKKGLLLPQRLNYFNAMLHFFFGLPRLIMIAAPLLFLLLGIHSFRADVMAVVAYILPHIVLSTVGNALISERFRHSFWGGVYEVSIAPYTAWVTLLALFNPRLGKFNVTDKGTNIAEARFDFATSRGPLLLAGLSAAALFLAFPLRLLAFDPETAAPAELHATLINALWAVANLVTLVAAACVAYEQPQQRRAPRVTRDFPCEMRLGTEVRRARCLDISESGVRVVLESPAVPDACELSIAGERGPVVVRAGRVWCEWERGGRAEAGLAFEAVGPETHRQLVELIFSDDSGWLRSTYPRDDPFRSFGYLLTTAWRVTQPRRPSRRHAPRVAGRWPCSLDGRAGACVSLSAAGGFVELAAPPASGGSVRVELAAGAASPLTLRGRVVRSAGGGAALAWEEDAVALAAVREVVATRRAATAQAAARRGLWRRAEAPQA
ncbi:MAG TPA: UDP-forming cellulose synthase catalytic subunit [Vicinamibacteria bacterium]|nr:UDP-forming cellulose synthase catalytic subunit [Vicinamibacteria bacterium]